MKTAIIYASKHGTTEKVVGAIVEKLKETNETTLFPLQKNTNPDISGFGMVILGSSIYAGQASRKMKTFCRKNESILLQGKTGLFVCGMHPDTKQREKELKDAYPAALLENAIATGFLGGEFLFEQMNFFERLIIKKISKVNRTVRRIDWDAIDDFVQQLL